MGILTRFTRLCKADLNGVLDQLEDKGLLLKQFLRDMEEEIGRKEGKLRQVGASLGQARQESEVKRQEQEKLNQDLIVAIEKDRDDIARFLIRKTKPIEKHQDHLQRHIAGLDQEMQGLQEVIDEHRLQYDELQLRAKEYQGKCLKEQREMALHAVSPFTSGWEPSEEEVELELLRQKEQAKGGDRS